MEVLLIKFCCDAEQYLKRWEVLIFKEAKKVIWSLRNRNERTCRVNNTHFTILATWCSAHNKEKWRFQCRFCFFFVIENPIFYSFWFHSESLNKAVFQESWKPEAKLQRLFKPRRKKQVRGWKTRWLSEGKAGFLWFMWLMSSTTQRQKDCRNAFTLTHWSAVTNFCVFHIKMSLQILINDTLLWKTALDRL